MGFYRKIVLKCTIPWKGGVDLNCVISPGRLNIIGEHTDYNDGYVLPFAINLHVKTCVSGSRGLVISSENMGEEVRFDGIEKTGKWTDYVMGVLYAMSEMGYHISDVRIDIDATLPMGAGLSSSSALTTSVAMAVSEHLGLGLSRKELFEICVKAEREFVGVRGGMMDQYTALFAKKDHAIFLDNRTLEFEYVPLNLKDHTFAVVDSGVKHSLVDGGYNRRREEADEVLKVLSRESHRDLTFEDLYDLSDAVLRKRARHVMEENHRVLEAVEALKEGDVKRLGMLLYESHSGLRDLYEVSCDETDFIVDFFRYNGFTGARMVGGGFGGGVIVLGSRGEIEDAFGDLEKLYRKRFGIEPSLLFVESDDGAREVIS